LKSPPSKIQLRIQRFDPKNDTNPHYDTFEISTEPRMTALDALFQVLETKDQSLAFRYSCKSAVCGSCAAFINGRPRLACKTQLCTLGPIVTIGPLPHLPVVRDLVVDLQPFYQRNHVLNPYFIGRQPYLEKEFIQTPKDRAAIDSAVDCIDCGACFSSCPSTWTDKRYPGPAAFVKAYRFIADTRDSKRPERLRAVACENGIWRCHTVFNCAEACPKAINPAYFVEQLKRMTVRLSIGQLRHLQGTEAVVDSK
jgi:succinate dehydrogenase / fumarate reductase iron-sulfur subunit